MGTTYSVKYARLPENLTREDLRALVEEELAAVNASMSTYDPDAEISKFNQQTSRDWIPVDPELARVVAQAAAIHDGSGGAFDVTIGPLVDAWGFGTAGTRGNPPQPHEIQEALARVGMDDLVVRTEPPALRKKRPDLEVDLSAIAKGHAVDRVAQVLQREGVSDYLVEIGGELRTAGRRYDGAAWRVGIEQPVAGERSVQKAIPMGLDGAVATSGDYRNFFELGDRRYAHILDPRTGMPVAHKLASVTVISADCATADGWATALSVLGTEQGYPLAVERGVAALFIEREETGLLEKPTPAFDNWLASSRSLLGGTGQ
jgi:thiamine biosynthesis lipoprotein